ncbi:hypothetical protein EYF80_015375 [Liparis tanakae]|uniref:Uncharacterized protein n=1 Tax=Liparis tanakae TaxID=230148 RepID=A0A4Z2I8R4_9TELE|nr:hypothetical protein EYF80_015375 [Liparis tanakae]
MTPHSILANLLTACEERERHLRDNCSQQSVTGKSKLEDLDLQASTEMWLHCSRSQQVQAKAVFQTSNPYYAYLSIVQRHKPVFMLTPILNPKRAQSMVSREEAS